MHPMLWLSTCSTLDADLPKAGRKQKGAAASNPTRWLISEGLPPPPPLKGIDSNDFPPMNGQGKEGIHSTVKYVVISG